MVVYGLDAAQAGRVVDDGFGTAETGVIAKPPGGQLPWSLTFLAATLFTLRTGDGIK